MLSNQGPHLTCKGDRIPPFAPKSRICPSEPAAAAVPALDRARRPLAGAGAEAEPRGVREDERMSPRGVREDERLSPRGVREDAHARRGGLETTEGGTNHAPPVPGRLNRSKGAMKRERERDRKTDRQTDRLTD